MPRKKKAAKKVLKKRPTLKRKASRPVPPTVEGVFRLIFTKRNFLRALLADMDGALMKAKVMLPEEERARLRTMLYSTYSVTGAEALSIVVEWMLKKVPPPPPPWEVTHEETPQAPLY